MCAEIEAYGATVRDGGVEHLAGLVSLAEVVAEVVAETVVWFRHRHVPWSVIGMALGITRQTAWDRYSRFMADHAEDQAG